MDVSAQLEQEITAKEAAELRSTDMSTSKKQKDPKKQEAGRKGAAVRQQMMEALKAELTAAKETVFQENNKEHAVDTKAHVSSEPTTTTSSHVCSPGWGVGIGLAVAAGVILFAVRPFAVQARQTEKPEGVKPSVPAPVHQPFAQQTTTTYSRSIFDME